MSSSKQQTTSSGTTEVEPWGPQKKALKYAFNEAKPAYQESKAAQDMAPTDYTAGLTPEQINTYHQQLGYGWDQSSPILKKQFGDVNTALGSAGAIDSLNRLSQFDPSLTNNLGNTIAGANAYRSGFDIPGAVDAAMFDAKQTARDITLPQITNAAAGTGNINSSRTAIRQGLVDRSLANQAAALSADLRNKSYEQGADITRGINTDNVNTMLRALQASGDQGGNLAQLGSGQTTGSIADTGTLFALANQGGAGLREGQQAGLTNELQQFQGATTIPFEALRNYMGIIGNQNWGSTTNYSNQSTTTSTPSGLQTAGGIIGGIGSLFGLSDRRMKEDIHEIGALKDGTPVYRYRYKGGAQYHIGLMADEVKPEAVHTVGDLKLVNYDEATKHLI